MSQEIILRLAHGQWWENFHAKDRDRSLENQILRYASRKRDVECSCLAFDPMARYTASADGQGRERKYNPLLQSPSQVIKGFYFGMGSPAPPQAAGASTNAARAQCVSGK